MIRCLIISFFLCLIINCQDDANTLTPVSVADFSTFIAETNYITDAEKFGWSIVQEDVYNFRTESNANWRTPNGIDSTKNDMPVTQVSYNDAIAYCKWANVRLPNYDEFWKLAKNDSKKIIENTTSIYPLKDANIIGNVWDITTTENTNGEIRLAGGSYLCNPRTCNGTNPNRVLYVDKMTGNTHISFSVVEQKIK